MESSSIKTAAKTAPLHLPPAASGTGPLAISFDRPAASSVTSHTASSVQLTQGLSKQPSLPAATQISFDQPQTEAVAQAVGLLRSKLLEQPETVHAVLRALDAITLNARIASLSPADLAIEVKETCGTRPDLQALAQELGLEQMSLESLDLLVEQTRDIKTGLKHAELNAGNPLSHLPTRMYGMAPQTDLLVDTATGKQVYEEAGAPERESMARRIQAQKERELNLQSTEHAMLSAFSDISSLDRDEGFYGLLHQLAEIDADGIALVKRTLGRDAASQVDLRARQNFIIASMLGEQDENRLRAIQSALHVAASGLALQPEQADLLLSLGIKIRAGQPINQVNNQNLSPAQLNQLSRLAEILQSSVLGGMNVSERAIQTSRPLIADSIQRLDAMKEIRAELEARDKQIDSGRQQLAETNQQLRQAQAQAATLAGPAEQLAQQEREVRELRLGIQSQGMAYLERYRNHPGTLNALLARWNLKLDVTTGRLMLRQNGAPIDLAKAADILREGHAELREQANEAYRRLVLAQAQVKALQAQADVEAAELERLVRQQQAQMRQLSDKMTDYRSRNLAELQALRQDPERWSALPPDERQLVEQLLAESVRELATSEASLVRFEQNNDAALTEVAVTAALGQVSRNLDSRIERIEHMAAPVENEQQLLAKRLLEEAIRLSNWADQLEQMLMLMPRPENVDVSDLARQWLESLSRLDAEIKAFLDQQTTQKDLEKTFSAQGYRQLQRRLDYHLRQLKSMDLRQTERIDQILRSSLNRVRSELSVLVPQTSEGLK